MVAKKGRTLGTRKSSSSKLSRAKSRAAYTKGKKDSAKKCEKKKP